MTKADIVNRIAVKSGISRKEVEVIVSNLMETLKSKMTEGENCIILKKVYNKPISELLKTHFAKKWYINT